MYDRKEVKRRARGEFQANYWLCVLIALILALFVFSDSGTGVSSVYSRLSSDESATATILNMNEGNPIMEFGAGENSESAREGFRIYLYGIYGMMPALVSLFIAFSLVFSLVYLVLDICVFNVLEVGGCSFYAKNTRQKADFSELGRGFSGGNYGNVVLTQLFRKLFICLWSFLFIIPGIVKSYEYMMIPYILADHPDMPREQVFDLSRQMLNGHKMDAFVLDLSFLGWYLLSILTFGIVGLFWTNPYYFQTKAEFYQTLLTEKGVSD